MKKDRFATSFLRLNDRPFSLEGRPYLPAIYQSTARRLVLRASRQVEKTTFVLVSILYYAVQYPGCRIIVVCPRQEQAHLLSRSRLQPLLMNSPLVARCLLGRKPRHVPVTDIRFANGSQVYFRAAFLSPDAVRGIDGDFLFVDEFQDIAGGHLPVLEEALSHSRHGRIVLTGTPKLIDNHLETAFNRSTAHEFKAPCRGCREGVRLDDRVLGPSGLQCPRCESPLDSRQGIWVPRNPVSAWGNGYWINHLMVPWCNYDELLDKQRSYDPALFRNECLGLPTSLGDHIVTREQLEACCTGGRLARSAYDVLPGYRPHLVGGIDWGGGSKSHTVMAVGYVDESYSFHVVAIQRFRAQEEPEQVLREVAEVCRSFGLHYLAADGAGNGAVYNRLLVARLRLECDLYAIHYSCSDTGPVQEGALWRWTIDRTRSLGAVFARIKRRTLVLPSLAACDPFLEDFLCELAEFDDHSRTIRYTHPETQTDDALHATNYALALALRMRPRQSEDYLAYRPVPADVERPEPTPVTEPLSDENDRLGD
jgi:hypothetical protein